MPDEIGPRGPGFGTSALDAASLVERIERARGTTPLVAPPNRPRVARDGVRLTARSKRMLAALASGEGDLDDPDFVRLRQLYQRPEQPEPDLSWPQEPPLPAPLDAAGGEPEAARPQAPVVKPPGPGLADLGQQALDAVQGLGLAIRKLFI